MSFVLQLSPSWHPTPQQCVGYDQWLNTDTSSSCKVSFTAELTTDEHSVGFHKRISFRMWYRITCLSPPHTSPPPYSSVVFLCWFSVCQVGPHSIIFPAWLLSLENRHLSWAVAKVGFECACTGLGVWGLICSMEHIGNRTYWEVIR